MNSKDKILSHLNAATPANIQASAPIQLVPAKSVEDKIQDFTSYMQAVRGEVHLSSVSDVSKLIKNILQDKGVSKMAANNAVLSSYKIDTKDFDFTEVQTLNLPDDLFDKIEVGITSTIGGIAATGSIALFASQQEPRSLSLVPPIHIALLEQDKIFNDLNEIIQKQNWQVQMPTNALIISGPSKTADIEQVLAYGVHGPKQLIVIIITA